MLCAFFLKIMSEPTGRMTRLLTCQIEHTPQNVQGYHSAPGGGKKTPGGRVSFLFMSVPHRLGFSGGSGVKESTCQCRSHWVQSNPAGLGSILGLGRSPGGGNGNPLQYSCLGNPMDRGAWWATVHGAAKSQTRLSN